MPIVRSRSPIHAGKTGDKYSSTSSLNVPTESSAAAPSIGTPCTVVPSRTAEASERPVFLPGQLRRSTRVKTKNIGGQQDVPPSVSLESLCPATVDVKQKNIGGSAKVPPSASSTSFVPVSRSMKSSRRSQSSALRNLEEKELEEAKAKIATARAEAAAAKAKAAAEAKAAAAAAEAKAAAAAAEAAAAKAQAAIAAATAEARAADAEAAITKAEEKAATIAAKFARMSVTGSQCPSEIQSEDDDFDEERSVQVERWVEQSTKFTDNPCSNLLIQNKPLLPAKNNSVPPAEDKPAHNCEISRLADAIMSATRSGQSSKVWDLPNFYGDYEEWLPFKRAYLDSVAQHTDVQNMARLRNSVKGKAREIVRSLLFVASNPSDVVDALEQRFGRPEQIALAEMEKIKELPRVSETPRDMCDFASRINNAVTTISALNKTEYLHSPETSKKIIEKMTSSYRLRWFDFKARSDDEPELVKIKNFLNHEASLCAAYAPPEFSKKKNTRHQVNAATDLEETASDKTKKFCVHCEKDHWLTDCKKFKDASTNERWQIAKKYRLCFKCLGRRHLISNCKGKSCKRCKRPHHTMLHSELTRREPVSSPQPDKPNETCLPEPPTENKEVANVMTSIYAMGNIASVYLKIIPVDIYGPKGTTRILALLDEGSTVSLIDKDVARRIGATGKAETLIIETVGGKSIEIKNSEKMNLKIKGAYRTDKRMLKGVRTIEDLKLAPQCIDVDTIERCSHLKNLKEKLLYEANRPALLIGQDNWDLIVSRKVQKGKKNEPVASLTSLGWVLHGFHSGIAVPVNFVNHCRMTNKDEEIADMIKRYFDLDSIGVQEQRPSNDADGRALALLNKTTKKRPDGRYESGMLWKTDNETLPNNYDQALNRLLGIEKKLSKDAKLKENYKNQLEYLVANGYAEKAPAKTTPGRTFYLPHFAVVHPLKKKTRIVFDAAARFNGKSLNDALLSGPDLLQSLFGVLLRFREGPVAVVADIKEMFLQIRIRQEDRDSLRYLWRGDNLNQKPEEFRMTSVIFGAASSPATAIFVKNHNAKKYEKTHPEAARAIIRNHYMDDYLQSFQSIEEASKTVEAVNMIHKEAGFELRQWATNANKALDNIRTDKALKEKQLGEEEKTLGLRWIADEDKLAFNIGLRNTPLEVSEGRRAPTKREVTSAVMSTFDPLGLVAPALIKGKKLIQDIWRSGIKWDETINEDQHNVWQQYIKDLKKIHELKIPRCLAPSSKIGELHTFVDASETAYAAAVFWRSKDSYGNIHVTLMAGKARVAPVKITSIPRLELQAALLGARLAATICKESDLEITSRTYWSDSTTVLHWMKADPRRFKTFVAHRLAAIEEITKPDEWKWVPSKENPADDATRNVPKDFDITARWFIGPTFLYQPESVWPVKKIEKDEIREHHFDEMKKVTCTATKIATSQSLPNPCRFSNWIRLLRATARIYMFMDLCRRKSVSQETPSDKRDRGNWLPIESEHLKKAKLALIRYSQQESFKNDIENIKKKKPLENSSRLKKVDVTLDEENILRLNTRTAKLRDFKANPKLPILDGKNYVSLLIIGHYHKSLHHGNHATVINELRQRFWILSLRDAVRQVVHQCQLCKIRRQKPEKPPLGDLPLERLAHHQPPFTCTGVDYFGPIHVTIGRRKEKRWGVLFTCLTTRAIHIELAASLSTNSMIMALKRFSSRRGSPKILFSDNGTNFVGAKRELKEEAKKLRNQDLIKAAENYGFKWKFIPPGAPNMGGAWERLVRSVKTSLSAVLNEKSPPEEVLYTLLTEVEHTVNSRPLTHLSAEPGDEESLTPNHFLIGRSNGAAILGESDDTNLIGRPNWKTAQRLADYFWKRWLKEYLPTLMPRKINNRRATNIQIGDTVLVADSSLPRNTWPKGVIEQTYPGPDGRTRIVDVRTKGGIMKRPTSRLIVIVPNTPSLHFDGVLAGARTGGENVSDDDIITKK